MQGAQVHNQNYFGIYYDIFFILCDWIILNFHFLFWVQTGIIFLDRFRYYFWLRVSWDIIFNSCKLHKNLKVFRLL